MPINVSAPDFLKFTAYLIVATAGLRLISGHLAQSSSTKAQSVGTALAGVTP